MINNIKNFFKRIFNVNKELTYEEEQQLLKEIFRKIRES